MAKRKAPRAHRPSVPASSRPAVAERFVRLLAPAAASWILLVAIDAALSGLIAGTSLNNGQLPLGAGIALTAYEFLVLAAIVGLIGTLLWLVGRIERPDFAAARWISRSTRAVIVGVAALLYLSSWALFWNTSVFLDGQAFAFLAAMNPLQVFQWVYPPLAMGVLAATIAVAVVFARWLPRWIAEKPLPQQYQIVLVGGSALAICAVAALAGRIAYGSETAAIDAPKSPYAVSRDNQAGPAAHAVADVRRALEPAPPPSVASTDTTRVIRRPIVSMEQYLSGVRQSDIKRFNVVMIQIESLRSDQLRAYGGTRDVMPAVDRLARESRVFTNAYVQASHSNYQDLVPLSSHYPLRSPQMYEYPPNPTYPRVLIYDVLKAIGYRTAIFSSQNERWGGMVNYHRPSSLDRFFHAETFSGPTQTQWGDLGFADWVKETRAAGSVDDKYTVSEAIQWLDGIGEEPFFVHMNLQSSHVPYVVPEDFPHRFSPKKLDFVIMWGKFPIDKVDIVKDRYADSLYYEDVQIGRLFDHLKSRGLWDNTIVVIGGDNGEAFYEHNFAAHASSLFNEVVKVPMIVRAPGLEPGVDDRPAMFLDVPPSVFQLLGLPPHPSFQGISLFEPGPDPNRSLFIIVQTPAAFQSAIVRSGFKLLHNELDGRYYLWDQVNDPAN